MIQIDIGIDKEKSTTEKGRVLEDLVAILLKIQQYDVAKTIRVTGMEIDVLAKHKISGETILVECKAWDSPLPADVISKLLGNVVIREADKGWLVTTGPLSKDALGTQSEWEANTNKRKMLSFYTSERIIEQLVDARIIKDIKEIRSGLSDKVMSEDAILLITQNEYYWIIPLLNHAYNAVSEVLVFYASNGKRVLEIDEISRVKHLSNYYGDACWKTDSSLIDNVKNRIEEEINSVVPVIGGDDWEDYRPARPQDFIGRKGLIQSLYGYFDNVISEKTYTRLFSLKAPSGMGKSSLILKLISLNASRRKSKKYFIFALDSRTAISTRYVEFALKSCFDQAACKDFIDVNGKQLEVSSINQMLQSDCMSDVMLYLKKHNKAIVLIFDQFEELFSKKELFPIFEKIKQLSNAVDQLQGNLIVGFSWKTDLTLPADHPAYYMWANLSDRRKEFDLPQFNASEIKGAIKVFGSQLGEDINPVLRNYLTKQCQGYPWLLKKLCIHIFKLLKAGNDQTTVIGQKLNIIDLFDKDISELTPEEHKCIIEIAKESPADYFKMVDLFSNDIIQTLVNKRIIIRRASRLTLYWDIFRDYVLDKKIPNIILDYIPQQQYATIAQILECLIANGDMATDDLARKMNMKNSTIENFIVDSVMFGIVKKENGRIQLTQNSEREIVFALREFFYKHIVYIELTKTFLSEFSYADYFKCFKQVFAEKSLAEKTKKTYAAKLINWFVNLGIIEFKYQDIYVMKSVPQEAVLHPRVMIRRTKCYGWEGANTVFWGETSPEKLKTAYEIIRDNEYTYDELKAQGLRNAVLILQTFGGVKKKTGIYYVDKKIDYVFRMIERTDTIKFGINILCNSPNISEIEMGELLREKFNRTWKRSSCIRYGSAIRLWCRFFTQEV